MPIPTIRATTPCIRPPAWAVLERALIAAMEAAVEPFVAKYTRADGSLIWGGTAAQHGRDDVDDFYEAFYNWPLLYLFGGDERLLAHARRCWEGVTAQLSAIGLLHREYERGADWFHQAEGQLALYLLCLADPTDPAMTERAQRFADFYTGADPEAPNYDRERRIIRSPHNGSHGPRWGYTDNDPATIFDEWHGFMEQFGLPFHDIPSISTFADLFTPSGARAMGEAMQQRYSRGDVVNNLLATSLAANAFLLTSETRFRDWALEYTNAWVERAAQNNGILPDNVGLHGMVGEDMDGKWYGGLYGWVWPHGFYNVGMAAVVASANATLLSGSTRMLDLARAQIDALIALGRTDDHGRFVVPYRHAEHGWFDFQPMSPVYPVAIWSLTHDPADWARIEQIAGERAAWSELDNARTKEDAGHELPWLAFLVGENPQYPEAVLTQSLGQVYRRAALLRADTTDVFDFSNKNIHLWVHLWQKLNPVSTEALMQLVLGAPQQIYNGGLPHAPLRYFDTLRDRPGLPEDVAALVERLDAGGVTVVLVNLSPLHERELLLQAGMFAEHRFGLVRYDHDQSDYPGDLWNASAPALQPAPRELRVAGTYLRVGLPPGSMIRLEIELQRFVSVPTYQVPPHSDPK